MMGEASQIAGLSENHKRDHGADTWDRFETLIIEAVGQYRICLALDSGWRLGQLHIATAQMRRLHKSVTLQINVNRLRRRAAAAFPLSHLRG
jgi:hypothetical protein